MQQMFQEQKNAKRWEFPLQSELNAGAKHSKNVSCTLGQCEKRATHFGVKKVTFCCVEKHKVSVY